MPYFGGMCAVLMVVKIEKREGSGRWQMLDNGHGPWAAEVYLFFYFAVV
jgi:hypothetical protein